MDLQTEKHLTLVSTWAGVMEVVPECGFYSVCGLGTPKTLGVTLKPSPGLLDTPDHHKHAHVCSAPVSNCLEWLDFVFEI